MLDLHQQIPHIYIEVHKMSNFVFFERSILLISNVNIVIYLFKMEIEFAASLLLISSIPATKATLFPF